MKRWKRAALLSGAGGPTGALSAPAFADINTTFTNDLSPDGMTWDAVGGAFRIDQHGKYIQYIQRYNSNTRLCYFIFSNDKGVTWADNTGISGGEGFLVRGSITYDAARDCIHGLIVTTNAGDGGIIYRRYSITRDGSNNITSIARVAGVSLSMDSAGAAYEFPTLIMTDTNTLLAAWTVRTAAPGGEIRACKCDITSNADAGGTASNWVHIGVDSTTTIGGAPDVGSYTVIFTQASNVFTYFSLVEMSSGDLGWFYHSGATPGQWRWRRSVKSGATWDSLSNPVAVSNMQVAGTDAGYELKNQLATKIVEDASGNVYCAAPVWLSDAAGDTVRLFKVTSADAVSSVTIYSAGGAHSYAPTCGLSYDSTSGRLIVTYIKTTTSFTHLQAFSTVLAQLQGETTVETATVCDIPLVVFARDAGKLGIAFRKQGSPPQPARWGALSWS